MPCHPDRVRANYHTVTSRTHDIEAEQIVQVSIALTRMEIASWMSPRAAARAVAERVYDQVINVFGGNR